MPPDAPFRSSRELLNRLGLSADSPPVVDDEELDPFASDLAPVLRERYQALVRRHPFAPGDLVTWKTGMANCRAPKPGQPAIVVEVLATPVMDSEQNSGSTYFREPLDLVLGVIWDDGPTRGSFITFHFNSQRFEPYRG